MKNAFFIVLFLVFCTSSYSLENFNKINPVYDSNKIFQKIGDKIDLNLKFMNQDGQSETLKSYLGNSSVLILTLNYYRCTTMCVYQFLNLAEILKESSAFKENKIKVASISFDPTDTIAVAKQTYNIWTPKTKLLNPSWNFFVGTEQNTKTLTQELNFYTEKDDEGNYSHAAALFFIRSDGTFYRYLYGIVYDKSEVSSAIYDTSLGEVGGIRDWFYELYHSYNPLRGKYISHFNP